MIQWIITSSVLIVIIAVLRFVLRGKISLKLQYALWGLVLIRLILPFSILESPASVLNLIDKREEEITPPPYYEAYVPGTINPEVPDDDIYILDDYVEQIAPDTDITIDKEGFVTEPEIRVISAKDVLIPIWVGGIAVFGTVFAVSNLRFSKKLKKDRRYIENQKTWVPTYVTSEVKTPCLFGAIKPSIYLTEEVLKDEKTICHVIEHETTHYRHGDHIWSVLRCFCLALHWYNPLVWLAAFLSMRDSELACDEDTIKRIGEEERIEYGRTLINLTCERPAVGIFSAATTMTGSKSSIRERILLIAKKPKMLWITAAFVAVIALFAVGCTFTGAVKYNPKTTDEPATETFSDEINFDFPEITGKVRMVVTEASPKEITTEIFNNTSEDINYRIACDFYFEQDGKWYVLPKINENDDDLDFGTKIIKSGKSGVWTNDIKEIYGKLPDGKYCIYRTFNYGEMDFSETEFYVIGTEFILEDGKLIAEYPSELEKTEYIPTEQIFMNFASSFIGIPNEKYLITDEAFIILDSETGNEIKSYAVSEWKWEEFPYSEEEWKALFMAPEEFPFPDISSYRSRYYQPIDDGKFIASMDGELWLVDIDPKKPGSEELWVWSIYKISKTEIHENNKAYWECAPAMSSKSPWFEFEFSFDFTSVSAGVYSTDGQGSLYDSNAAEDYNALNLENGEVMRWIPYNGETGLNLAKSAKVNFSVYQNDDLTKYTHTGTLNIKQISSENGITLYEAVLVSDTLCLFQNEETGIAIISEKPAENIADEYTEEEYEAAVKELGYTEEQLENIERFIEEGLSPLAVINPLKYSKETGEITWPEELTYSLGSFYFDPEVYGDYGGPLGFLYIRKDGKISIVPENLYSSSEWGVLDGKHFFFGGTNEIRIYNIDDISKPEAVWNFPKEKLVNKEWNSPILTSAASENNGEVIVIWVNRPEDFDEPLRGKNLDKTNYMITVVDSEGKTVGEYDTGIKIKLNRGGLSDVMRPEIVAAAKNRILFKVNNLHYVFDYGKDNPIAEQYIFTENDVVKYSNIDFRSEFAESAVKAVTEYIEKKRLENKNLESFSVQLAEIDGDATNRELNYDSLPAHYSYDDILNNFLVVKTITKEIYQDGTTETDYFKYFVLYDPENWYDNGTMLGESGWKLVDGSKESFDIPEFSDSRFYYSFEEKDSEQELSPEDWVKNLKITKIYETERPYPQVIGEIFGIIAKEKGIEIKKIQRAEVYGSENEFAAAFFYYNQNDRGIQSFSLRMRKTDEGYGFLTNGGENGIPVHYGLEEIKIPLEDIAYNVRYKEPDIKEAEAGDMVVFGNYHGMDEWIVLDKKGTKILLISRECLDAMPYNTERTDVTWETSSVRKWLNESFINEAFSEKEKAAIVSTRLDNPDNERFGGAKGGNSTTDKVFLLSKPEAEKYFPNESGKGTRISDYAASKGMYKMNTLGEMVYWWWLRSPGLGQDMASVFCINTGGVGDDGLPVEYKNGIRPAIWVDTSKI